MPYETIALVIGVSEYAKIGKEDLPAAQADAIHFARALHFFGIKKENLFLFLNESATFAKIDEFLTKLTQTKETFKFLFYFCGHGFRSDDHHSFLLLNDSWLFNHKILNALHLDTLIHRINQTNVIESYFFIDACSLRINQIINPKLEEEIKGNKLSKKSLFCLLSSGIEDSFENESEKYGYFTRALLKGLSHIDRIKGSPSELFEEIYRDMSIQNLPIPEMYSINHQKISFVLSDESFVKQGMIYRKKTIEEMQQIFLKNPQKILCLMGEEGSGKTTFCQFLNIPFLKSLVIDLENFKEGSEFLDFLLKALILQETFVLNAHLSKKINLKNFCEAFPFYLVIVENIEKLNLRQMNDFLDVFPKLKMQFLFTVRQSLKPLVDKKFENYFIDVSFPPFSELETKQFLETHLIPKDQFEIMHRVSFGNPQKLKKIALISKDTSQDALHEKGLKKTIAALAATGIFFDKHLFASVFQLDEKHLSFLEEIGLLTQSENGYFPDEIIYDIAENEELEIDGAFALNYWLRQTKQLPTNLLVLKHLILCTQWFGYEKSLDPELKNAFQFLYLAGKDYLKDLIESVEIFISLQDVTEASCTLAEILLNLGYSDLTLKLIQHKNASEELVDKKNFLESYVLCQLCHFEEAISKSSKYLKRVKNPFYGLNFCYQRGLAHFFMGNTDKALADFITIYENAIDERFVARSLCMLGTILGGQGIDLDRGKKHLNESLKVFEKTKELSGIWAVHNNLGEIFVKSGDYHEASSHLDKALSLAKKEQTGTLFYETARNLSCLYLHWKGPFSENVSTYLKHLENRGAKEELSQRMSILNTMAKIYISRGNFKEAFFLLKKVACLTVRYKKYHIDTLTNMALLANLLNHKENEILFKKKGQKLSEESQNFFALRELTDQEI